MVVISGRLEVISCCATLMTLLSSTACLGCSSMAALEDTSPEMPEERRVQASSLAFLSDQL